MDWLCFIFGQRFSKNCNKWAIVYTNTRWYLCSTDSIYFYNTIYITRLLYILVPSICTVAAVSFRLQLCIHMLSRCIIMYTRCYLYSTCSVYLYSTNYITGLLYILVPSICTVPGICTSLFRLYVQYPLSHYVYIHNMHWID